MPSKEKNLETIKFGDYLLLLNQYWNGGGETGGYLNTWGSEDGKTTFDKTTFGVRTSQDPDRDTITGDGTALALTHRDSGTWKLEPIGSGSGPLKYGDKFRLVNLSLNVGYLETYVQDGESDMQVRARQEALADHIDTETWQIEPIEKTSNNYFVQNGDTVKLVNHVHSGGENKTVYLDTNGCPKGSEPGTYFVKTCQTAERDRGSGTWQIIRRSPRDMPRTH